MRRTKPLLIGLEVLLPLMAITAALGAEELHPETTAGWKKYAGNPVLGGTNGTCFDVSVLRDNDGYRMWLSWRPQHAVAVVESTDGMTWTQPPRIVLAPNPASGWEEDINRPCVLKRGERYEMWYTGQAKGKSSIGYATSSDGTHWNRAGTEPVFAAQRPWEKVAVMCPHVLWDAEAGEYQMWYSGGDQYEPDAIGYATSKDGRHWSRKEQPVFSPGYDHSWDGFKVTAVQVIKEGGWYVMFYIGFRDVDHAQIGLARSRDGITGWERHPLNPIIRPGQGQWDADACYKPFAIFDGKQWLLWYNGRRGSKEQIGVAVHPGEDLGFDGAR